MGDEAAQVMAGTTPGVFLSYRREDTRHFAGRLADWLTGQLNSARVFMDVDTIAPGADFATSIAQAIASCSVLIAVIGPAWLTTADARGRRRLDDPDDFVVLEIQAALEQGMHVIPVLVDGAVMPKRSDLPLGLQGLTQRNAVRIDHETFRSDFAALLSAVEQSLPTSAPEAPELPVPEEGPQAAYNLGWLLDKRGDVPGAQAAYQRAIDSNHTDWAPAASNNLGQLLDRRGDTPGAQTAYQRAIDSNHPDWAPTASNNLGQLLDKRGDTPGAQAAYQRVIDSNHPDQAPAAARHLGWLLDRRGDTPGAQAAYQRAIDSNHPDQAPAAAYELGRLLTNKKLVRWFANQTLGWLLVGHKDVVDAQAAYQRAIDSDHPDWTPRAANDLGVLLRKHGDAASVAADRRLSLLKRLSRRLTLRQKILAGCTGGSIVAVSTLFIYVFTAIVPTVDVGSDPSSVAVAPDGRHVYVTDDESGNVSVIDTESNTVTATIPVDAYSPNIAVAPDNRHVYVTDDNSSNGNVSVIDTTSNTVTATIPVDAYSPNIAVAPDGRHAYVTDYDYNSKKGSVSVIDTARNTVAATIPVDANPSGVTLAPDGRHAYVTGYNYNSNFSSGNVSVINTTSNTVTGTISVGSNATSLVMTPDNRHAYVTDNNSSYVSVIDTTSNTVTGKIPVSSNPSGVAVAPDGRHVYVTDYNSGNLSVVDTTTNTVTATISVQRFSFDTGLEAVAVTPDGRHAYIINYNSNKVSIVDLADLSIP